MNLLSAASLLATVAVASSAVAAATGCTNETFPFTYFGTNGDVVPGTAGDDGICTFPEANCGPDAHVYDCCKKNDDAPGYKMSEGSSWMLIAIIPAYAQIFWRRKYGMKPGEDPIDISEMVPGWVDGLPRIFQTIFKLGIGAVVLPSILIPIYMNQSIQANLSASNRNALLGASAFLDPYREIFQFVEDIVLIRVSYSLALRHKKETNMLVHVGIMGAFIFGLVAAVIGTLLGIFPASLDALTNPGGPNDAEVYEGCDLFDYSSDDVRPYWLLEMWGIPGLLLGMVLNGFLFGAKEILTMSWIAGIGMCMVPAVWFGVRAHQSKSGLITLLGLADIVADWTFPLLCLAYLVSPLGKDVRENTGFTFSLKTCKSILWKKSSESLEEGDRPPSLGDASPSEDSPLLTNSPPAKQQEQDISSKKAMFIDGLKIMSLDLATQIGITTGVYLSLLSDASVGYQITALQAALPGVGVAFSFSLGFMFKMIAPKYIVHREYDLFAKFTYVTLACGFLLFPVIIAVQESFKVGYAFSFGENACEYAKDDKCVGFFSGVFGENASIGTTFTLPFTWHAMSYAACIDVMGIVTRSILLTCKDYDYMLKGVAVSLVLYIPAVIAVTVGDSNFVGQAISIFAVMYLPQLITTIVFLVRIIIVLKKMKNGESGPWEGEVVNRASINKLFRYDSKCI